MRLSEINLENYETLEELCVAIESRTEIPDDDTRNCIRYQLFKRWHDENGFSWEDAEFVRACRFDVDCFKSEKELKSYESQTIQEVTNYRKQREQKNINNDEYIKKSVRDLKKQAKKLKKVKGARISREDLRNIAKMQYEKESEICAAIATADKTLTRKLKRAFIQARGDDDVLDNSEITSLMEIYIEEHRTAERLVKEVILNEGDIYDRADLEKRAEEYIANDGLEARTTLLTTGEEFAEKADAYIEKNQKKIFLWAMFGITISNLIILIVRYIMCIMQLDRVVLSTNPIYMFGMAFISIATWVLLTTQDYFNFYNRKWKMLIIVCINISATFIQVLYTMTWDHLVVNIFKIKTNDLFTPNMVLSLARIAVVVAIILGGIIAYKMINPFITASEVKEKILSFKLSHVVDERENKEYKYDFIVIRDLLKGSIIPVKENDLFTHLLMIGASGTGKTSSVYLPQIIANIERKIKNLDLQQQEVLKLVRAGYVEIIKPFNKGKFNRSNFAVVNPAKQKDFDNIFKKYEDCGITVVAPNNSLNEDILKYTSGRGIWVYNLDPTKKKATHKYEKLVGMNPFYMPPRFHEIKVGDADAEEERNIYIAEAANNFADTLTAINELNGTGDQYFTDVNTTVTNAVATVLMLDASIRNIQITIEDVYNCIVDYSLLTPVVNNIKKHFDIKYQAEIEDKKKKPARPVSTRNNDLVGLDEGDGSNNNTENTQVHHVLADSDRKNPYLQTIITVESRLQKGSKMDEHAEGLRNLLGKLLQDPRVKRVLVTNREIIDFNTILAENAITLVNTALDIGKNTSTCFGQLFILSFNTAVLRRPKNTRTPHFFYEDETARYLSDTIDTMITLYRQYRVACMFALQSLEQVESVKKLAYLKNVLLSAGTIITFGRASYQDAQQISELSGQVKYLMAQNTVSRTAITASNASSSFSTRTTPDQKNYLESNDIRARDFQECTIITTDNGRVMPGRLAKVFFVPKEIIDAESPAQIKRREEWEKVWTAHYPLLEDTMTPSPDNMTSPDIFLETAKELQRRSQQSVTIERDPSETHIFSSLMQPKGAETMSAILNADSTKYENVSQNDMQGQIEIDNEWDDEDFAVEEDDDFGIVYEELQSSDKSISITVPSSIPGSDSSVPDRKVQAASGIDTQRLEQRLQQLRK